MQSALLLFSFRARFISYGEAYVLYPTRRTIKYLDNGVESTVSGSQSKFEQN